MNLFSELLPKCCHTHAPTHVTGPSCKLSIPPYLRPTMVLPILVGTSGNVAPRTHIKSHEVRLVWSTFAAAGVVRVALYCQINWISLAVVGGCRLCSWSEPCVRSRARISCPSQASLEAAHEMSVSRHGRRHWTGLARHVARRRSPAFPIGHAIRSRCRKSPLPPCGQGRRSTTWGTLGR